MLSCELFFHYVLFALFVSLFLYFMQLFLCIFVKFNVLFSLNFVKIAHSKELETDSQVAQGYSTCEWTCEEYVMNFESQLQLW